MPFIIDASVALAWALPDEQTDISLELLNRAGRDGVVVPSHFTAEVANGLWANEPKRTTPADSAEFLKRLRLIAMFIDKQDSESIYNTILPLARAHRLTIYDALYLELAERTGLLLATFDGPLAKASRAIGLEVYP